MMPLVLAALMALPTATPPSAASTGSEFHILDGFLAQYDVLPDEPHCLRVAGMQEPSDGPSLPVDHFNGTNHLMDHHMMWHTSHVRMAKGEDPQGDANLYGEDFVMMHRMMIAEYDAWRATQGYGPTPVWNPADPVPPEYAYARPEACAERHTDIKPVPAPSWLTVAGGKDKSPIWNYTSLCEFPTMNRLGKALDPGAVDEGGDSYHGAGHSAVGGDMDNADVSMRDPLFWGWHKFLDSRVLLWETACGHALDMDGMGMTSAALSTPRAVPGPGLGVTLAFAVAFALALRRR